MFSHYQDKSILIRGCKCVDHIRLILGQVQNIVHLQFTYHSLFLYLLPVLQSSSHFLYGIPFKMPCFQLLSRAFLSYRGLSPERSSEQLLVSAPGWFRQVLVLGGSRHFETLCDVLVWVRSFVLGCRGSGDSGGFGVGHGVGSVPFLLRPPALIESSFTSFQTRVFFAFFLLCFYFYQLIAPRGISCHRWHEQFGRVSNRLEKARITYLCAQMPQVWWELLTYLTLLTLLD